MLRSSVMVVAQNVSKLLVDPNLAGELKNVILLTVLVF